MRPQPFLCLAIATLLALWSVATPAGAVGYWNLPGSFCQCAGFGWGAGYHAPFVLGPITLDDCCAHNEVRLPHAPSPPCAYYGCSGCACGFDQPSVLEPVELSASTPTLAPPQTAAPAPSEPAPTPTATTPTRPIFDAPVEP